MHWRFPIFIRNIFRKERIDRELDDEIRSYLEDLAAENVRRGMSREEALRQARKELGGLEQVKEGVRDIRTGVAMDTLMQDLRYGLRTLRKHRSFSFVTIFTLALGIGVCTAIFSLVNAVLIRSLPYGEPEKLVYLYTPNTHFTLPAEVFTPSAADFFDLKRQSQSFANATLFSKRPITWLWMIARREWARQRWMSTFSIPCNLPRFRPLFNAPMNSRGTTVWWSSATRFGAEHLVEGPIF